MCHRIEISGKSENKAFKGKLELLEINKKQNIANLSRERGREKKGWWSNAFQILRKKILVI